MTPRWRVRFVTWTVFCEAGPFPREGRQLGRNLRVFRIVRISFSKPNQPSAFAFVGLCAFRFSKNKSAFGIELLAHCPGLQIERGLPRGKTNTQQFPAATSAGDGIRAMCFFCLRKFAPFTVEGGVGHSNTNFMMLLLKVTNHVLDTMQTILCDATRWWPLPVRDCATTDLHLGLCPF